MTRKRIMTDDTGEDIVEQLKILNSKRGSTPYDYVIYGFKIEEAESSPSGRVSYLKDAIGKTPAYMDYATGKFFYGDWEDAFFMPRPCMVKSSGDVDYYLDPWDYSKKVDGTASDISNDSYNGNAMMEWGRYGQKIWYKIEGNNYYISNVQVDGSWNAWSFMNSHNEYVDHFYTAIYNGYKDENNKMRSLSGKQISASLSASAEITACELNNPGDGKMWYTDTYADRVLINILLTLIGKSTNHQAVFGSGLSSGGQTALEAYRTGALNNNGLFYGYNDGTHGVKVFGMENWYSAQFRRTAGLINDHGTLKYKLTYGTGDGSTATSYNTTGTGYIETTAVVPEANGYISKTYKDAKGAAFLPIEATAASNTYFCDHVYRNDASVYYALFGGASGSGANDGSFCVGLRGGAGSAAWGDGCALSLKPLA